MIVGRLKTLAHLYAFVPLFTALSSHTRFCRILAYTAAAMKVNNAAVLPMMLSWSILLSNHALSEKCDGFLNLALFTDDGFQDVMAQDYGVQEYDKDSRAILKVIVKSAQQIMDATSSNIKFRVVHISSFVRGANNNSDSVDASSYLQEFCDFQDKVDMHTSVCFILIFFFQILLHYEEYFYNSELIWKQL